MLSPDFTPSCPPHFEDTVVGGQWHLYWRGGREWLETLCGKARERYGEGGSKPTGSLCVGCAAKGLRIIANWRADEARDLRFVRREKFRIVRGTR